MIIDGRKIRDEIKDELRSLVKGRNVGDLALVVVGDDPVTARFVHMKEEFARDIGVSVARHDFPSNVSFEELAQEVQTLGRDEKIGGIVVQLPLPKHLDTQKILDSIPVEKDVDVLSTEANKKFMEGTLPIMPPVISAMKEICAREYVELKGKSAVVIGAGRLVGAPGAAWLRSEGAEVFVVDKPEEHLGVILRDADIIVCGAGSPHLVKPDMIKEGVIILDAGASEEAGVLKGDADPTCAEKAHILTPVPGGIGPMTVALLFKNLVAFGA